ESFLTHGKQGSSSSNSAQGPAELFSSTFEPGRLEFTQVGPKFNGLYNAMGFDPNYETTQGGYLFLIGWVWNPSNTLQGALLQMGSDGIPFNTGTITGLRVPEILGLLGANTQFGYTSGAFDAREKLSATEKNPNFGEYYVTGFVNQ